VNVRKAATGKVWEDDLCREFAECVRTRPDFMMAILSQTKFAKRGAHARLLHTEQVAARPKVKAENWWRHWWCKIPELNMERETDIFLVFEDQRDASRFALHVENKLDARFTPGQACDYEARASWMANQTKYLSYSDFATVLLCPSDYADRHPEEVSAFSAVIHHRTIANDLPAFREGC
jgi:hypothetical protein